MTLQLVRTVGRVVVSLVLVGVVSCGSESTGLTNVEVSNETDTLRADVNQSGSITGGTATLEIRDGDGAQVYVRSLAETGTFETDAGAAGNWTIRVSMVGTSGVLNFRVEKP
jgi:hypothetical protein